MFTVKDAMSTHISACHTDTNLELIAQHMWDLDCESIPITDTNNKPKGIITDRDITMAAMFKRLPLKSINASDIVSKRLFYFCYQKDSLNSWLKIMRDNKLKSLPVVDHNDNYIGMVTHTNALSLAKAELEISQNNTELNSISGITKIKQCIQTIEKTFSD